MRRMRRVIVAAAAVGVLQIAACGSDADDSAGGASEPMTGDSSEVTDAVAELVRLRNQGRFSEIYDSLLPAQQQVVSESAFTQTYEDLGMEKLDLRNLEVVEMKATSEPLPRVKGTVDGVLVSLSATLVSAYDGHRETGVPQTYYMVKDGDDWSWAIYNRLEIVAIQERA
jgi:hypothetical protein